MFPMWVYVTAALVIALGAFAIGQFAPGMGVPFAALASTLWVAFSVQRRKRLNGSC